METGSIDDKIAEEVEDVEEVAKELEQIPVPVELPSETLNFFGGDELRACVDEDVSAFVSSAEEEVKITAPAGGDERQAALRMGTAFEAVTAPFIDIARSRTGTLGGSHRIR